jgi:hypothetical protein
VAIFLENFFQFTYNAKKRTIYRTKECAKYGYEQYEAILARLEDLSDLTTLEEAANEPERDYADFLAEMGLSEEVKSPD